MKTENHVANYVKNTVTYIFILKYMLYYNYKVNKCYVMCYSYARIMNNLDHMYISGIEYRLVCDPKPNE